MEELKGEDTNWNEKKGIAGLHIYEPKVTLNVGGQLFATTTATLTRIPESLVSGHHALTQEKYGAHFIDRDGTHRGVMLLKTRNRFFVATFINSHPGF